MVEVEGVKIVAHRGDCQHFVENTLASVKAALDAGINAIEIDIQLTKDAVPILFHDRNLKRLLGKQGSVADFNFVELNSLPFIASAKSQETAAQTPNVEFVTSLSLLVELLTNYPKVELFVEVKRINFLYFSYQQVYQLLQKHLLPIKSQVVVISFSYRFLRYFRLRSMMSLGYVLPSWQQYNAKMLQRLSPQYLFCNVDIVPKSYAFESSSYTWVLYEITSPNVARHFIERGVKGLETFTPNLLKHQLNDPDFN